MRSPNPQITDLQGRVAILETGVPQRQPASKASSKQVPAQPQRMLLPLNADDLAKQLGVSAEAIENAASKGSASFVEWSKR